MSVILRDYQKSQVSKTWAALNRAENQGRVLLQAPTGAGKTAMGTDMVHEVMEIGGRVYFIVHREELVHQTSLTFSKYGIAHSFIAAGRKYDSTAQVFICSIDTLKNEKRLDKIITEGFAPDVILWDECHHIAAAGWTKTMKKFPDAWHIGLSATPCRLDGGGLDTHFGELIPGPAVEWLIEHGHLSHYQIFAPFTPELAAVHTSMGDWKADELEDVMQRPGLTGDAVEHWKRHASGLRTVVFAISVKHSKSIAETFNRAGVPAAHLDGDTPAAERAETIRRFADGELLVLTNVSLFGEGFDLSAVAGRDVTIDCVMLMRPTQSLSLYLQQVGRCLRPFVGKIAIILDHAGNCARHDFPDTVRVWTLVGKPKGKGAAKEDGPPPPATCMACYRQVRRPCPKACPHCGGEMSIPKDLPKFSKEELRELKRLEVEAEKAAKAAAKAIAKAAKDAAAVVAAAALAAKRDIEKDENRACKTEAEFVALGRARKYDYPAGWARQQMSSRPWLRK